MKLKLEYEVVSCTTCPCLKEHNDYDEKFHFCDHPIMHYKIFDPYKTILKAKDLNEQIIPEWCPIKRESNES